MTWGNIVDRGKERQVKLVGLEKWGLQFITGSLPVMLQFALLLFGIALVVYLWDLEVSASQVVLVVACIGLAFYAFIAVAATLWKDCPFQTPLSVLLPQVLPCTKEFAAFARLRLRRWSRRQVKKLLGLDWVEKYSWLRVFLERVLKRPSGRNPAQNRLAGDLPGNDRYMTLSNPDFWRLDPLFPSPIQEDIAASAGFWLLENSTDFSSATAVAAVFPDFQWPSHFRSPTALISSQYLFPSSICVKFQRGNRQERYLRDH